ncbi:serine--tRNA ligase [bacterium]|nr:serine--tRNA ligase [bacterium]|tara:strand:- start:87849 stop:89126 length:1278 start_codon:yes stop_codon:yes gene_type:complete
MLDIKFIREHLDLVKDAARKKHVDVDIDGLVRLDHKRTATLQEVEKMRAEQNESSKKISETSDESEREEKIQQMRALKTFLQKKEQELETVMQKWRPLMLQVPNIPDMSVPEGESDADNKEAKTWGKIPEFSFEPKNHVELMKSLNMVDFERGTKVAGFRGYFLKNDAVTLSLALWRFVFDCFNNSGYEPLMAPSLVRGENLYGTGHLPHGVDDIYKTQDDLYLSATAEIPLMGMYANEVFDEKDLPKKFLAFSPCFRREAGAHGKDTTGIYRVHEFFKVEQFIFGSADHQDTVVLHEELTKNAEEVLQKLEIPYRVVINCGGDLGRAHVKTHDIEAWIPSENRYGESHSSSYYHDFQTRRLNIRYRDKDGSLRFVYSLNNTALATPRILISIIENNQQEDGSIKIPRVLQGFMEKEVIRTTFDN